LLENSRHSAKYARSTRLKPSQTPRVNPSTEISGNGRQCQFQHRLCLLHDPYSSTEVDTRTLTTQHFSVANWEYPLLIAQIPTFCRSTSFRPRNSPYLSTACVTSLKSGSTYWTRPYATLRPTTTRLSTNQVGRRLQSNSI